MRILSGLIITLILTFAVTVIGREQIPVDTDNGPKAANKASLPPLLDATLEQLSYGLEHGLFTSVDLVRAYIARIEETNEQLHSVTEINPDALALAASLDASRREGRIYGPLHGIPVLLKNNIATADRMNTTAGSFALLGARVAEDSTVAARLRRAGAILLGKSNLSQWSDARSRNSTSGWSADGGQTHGAYYFRPGADGDGQMPCGSSAGSGVAASVGLTWAALGTETAGSIQCPACFNNVVGIKPTVGLTSRHLVVPISEHQDTVGPLARTVKDAAYLLSAIVGRDSNDNYTSAIPFDDTDFPDYVKACQLSALEGKRIGIARELLDYSDVFNNLPVDGTVDHVMAAFNQSLEVIRSAGAVIIDDVAVPGWKTFLQENYMRDTMRADLVTGIARYLAKLTTNPNNLTSLYDVQQFTQNYAPEEWPDRDTFVWDEAFAVGMNNSSPEFWANLTLGRHLSGENGILGALRNHSLDALVMPTYSALTPPAMVGSPAVTVPMGFFPPETPIKRTSRGDLVEFGPGIPFGISFLGDLFSEETLVGVAYAFEQKTKVRDTVRPSLQPKTELWDVIRGATLVDEDQQEL